MGKPKRRLPKRSRPGARKRQPIDLLALGEGTKPARVYAKAKKTAEAGRNAKFIIVDLGKPKFKPPETLTFVSGDAIKFLENCHPNSVKRVEDKYFWAYSGFGKKVRTPEDILKINERMLAEMNLAQAGAKLQGKSTIFRVHRNRERYIKLVKRALVPGGKFVIMTGPDAVQKYSEALEEVGFMVTRRQLTREQIMKSGSVQARYELRQGNKRAHLIIATKPKVKK